MFLQAKTSQRNKIQRRGFPAPTLHPHAVASYDMCGVLRRVLLADVSGGQVRGRPRLGWMDALKVAFGQQWDKVPGIWANWYVLGYCVGII